MDNMHSVYVSLFNLCYNLCKIQRFNPINSFPAVAFPCSMKQFRTLVQKLDENVDTISPKVNSAVTRLEKKYEVSLALYQRFDK